MPIPGIYSPAQGIAVPLVAPLNLAVQTSSVGTTANQNTLPAGINAGDLIVIFDTASNNSGAPAAFTPTGFTNFVNVTAGNNRCVCHYKIAAGTETGNIGGMNGGISNNRMNYVFRGVRPITAVTPAGIQTEITDGDPSAKVIAVSAGAVPLISMACYRSTGVLGTRTFSTTADGEIATNTTVAFARKIVTASPADNTIDMPDNGNDNGLIGFYLQITG